MNALIFNADDYGLSPGVSQGIRDAARGVVRSTTVMANMAADIDLAALAGAGLGCGAHLNLSCGSPLTADYPGALLTERGEFNKQHALDHAIWESAAFRTAAGREWQAQVDYLTQRGINLTHLDSHHHTHLHAELLPLALALASRLKLPLRTADARQRSAARAANIPTPSALVLDFYGNNCIGRESLLAALGHTQGGVVEVMCHPGRVDALLQQRSSYVAEREQELATLGGLDLAAVLEARGWQICDYTVLY